MGRVVHFEVHVEDMERAKKFYGEVFGWKFEDWSEYAGMPYFGAVTGDEGVLGIDGALIKRQGKAPETWTTHERFFLYYARRGLRFY